MKIAIALDQQQNIQSGHFGEACNYKIFEGNGKKWKAIYTLKNTLRNYDENQHGSTGKGKGIVKLLNEKGIQAAVSKQFGKNISIVRQYFVPIVTSINSAEVFLEHLDVDVCNKINQKETSSIKPLRIP